MLTSLAANPALRDAQLWTMVAAHGPRVAAKAAGNPSCPPDLLIQLAQQTPPVRRALRRIAASDTSQSPSASDGFNRHHGAGWLSEHAAIEAVHYLRPVFVHPPGRRPEFSPHWRCMLLLTMRDGQEVFSLVDV
ncbi:hypothetical protein [Micromonospora sp. NPDC005367]|uniref:hypothetical protein n=1 Tax=Micromonospora sp. NPDC005367 TaxID=3155590 RepID=UPI0033A5B22B